MLDIIFSDEDILIINKPSGIHSVGGTDSVAAQLLQKYPHLKNVAEKEEEAGLLNRLDQFTSGLMLAALHREAWVALKEASKQERLRKRYLVVLEGNAPEHEVVENYTGTPHRHAKKVKVYIRKPPKRARALFARSEIKRLSYSETLAVSLAAVEVSSARRHQVRAHCSFVGCPLVGDELYGSKRSPAALLAGEESAALPPFVLHAELLALPHPRTDEWTEFKIELPALICNYVRRLGIWRNG